MEIRIFTFFLLTVLWTKPVRPSNNQERITLTDTGTIHEKNSVETNYLAYHNDENHISKSIVSQDITLVSNENNKLRKVRRKTDDTSEQPHSRQKRLLWITNDGRLALPPGTSLVITPTLSMPFVRHPPEGFFSNITISVPLTVDFDKLGLTDNENPYGDLPPIFSRSFGKAAGGYVADFVGKYLDRRRGKRDVQQDEVSPQIQQKIMAFLHGGERALLFGALEDFLANFGLDGKPCLLRAICEVHAHPLTNFGLFGEMVKLFLTASKSPYSILLREYVEAEKAGRGDEEGPGECWPYFKNCPKSLFLPSRNKYTKDAEKEHQEDIQRLEKISDVTKLTLQDSFNDNEEINEINVQPM